MVGSFSAEEEEEDEADQIFLCMNSFTTLTTSHPLPSIIICFQNIFQHLRCPLQKTRVWIYPWWRTFHSVTTCEAACDVGTFYMYEPVVSGQYSQYMLMWFSDMWHDQFKNKQTLETAFNMLLSLSDCLSIMWSYLGFWQLKDRRWCFISENMNFTCSSFIIVGVFVLDILKYS